MFIWLNEGKFETPWILSPLPAIRPTVATKRSFRQGESILSFATGVVTIKMYQR
jgi:hypothetical protein